MPYLLIASPEFSLEQKKIMAAELTDAILQALEMPEECRDWITIRFATYRADEMAIGGRLISETEDPDYYLEFHDHNLTQAKKKILVHYLLPLVLELLGLEPALAHKVNMMFREYQSNDFAIGGRFISDMAGMQA